MPATTKPAAPRLYQRVNGPVAWFLMDAPRRTFPGDTGDVADLTGTARAGTRSGGAEFAAGPRGLRLANGGGYVRVPYHPLVDFSAGVPFTVSGTVSFGTTFGDAALAAQFSSSPSNYSGWMVWLNATSVILYINGAARATASASGLTNTDIRVDATWDGATAAVYLNGVLKASSAYATPPANTSNDLLIGGYGGDTGLAPGFKFAGAIDDVRVYRRALTAAEIAREYADPYWRLRRTGPHPAALAGAAAAPNASGSGGGGVVSSGLFDGILWA